MHGLRLHARQSRTSVRSIGGILAILAAGVAVVSISFAHRPPDLDESAGAFPRNDPTTYDVSSSLNEFTMVPGGALRTATGDWAARLGLEAGPYSGGAEAAARAYLEGHGAEYGLVRGGVDLRTAAVTETPGGWVVQLVQMLGDLPLWRADLTVGLDRSGQFVRSVYSNYDSFAGRSAVAPAAVVSSSYALAAAAGAIGLPEVSGSPADLRPYLNDDAQVSEWLVRQDDRIGAPIHRVWRVFLPATNPAGGWVVQVDAADGSLFSVEDSRVFVDGSGMVFNPDPLTTAEVPYGGQYSDLNDGDTAELNAERVSKPLPDLTFNGSVYQLIGPWVRIVEFEAPSSPPVTNPDPHGFVYTRSQQGFEDVNVYHHIDLSQRHMQALGFMNIQNTSIQIDTHGLNGADNSHYLPGSNRISYGEGGVDDAEDVDVVIHEYGHAIQYWQVPGWGGGQQGAMGEGFGDYWAGSFSSSISLFRSEWVFNWDGHNPFWSGRVLNSTLHYPEGLNGQVHHDGQIWSAPLMQCYYEVGREIMDQLVLQGHYLGGTGTTMPLSAAAIMQADLNLHGGLHASSLDHYFTARGFFTASQYDVPILTHTPLEDTENPGPYPVTVMVASTSTVNQVSIIFGTGSEFDNEVIMTPAGGGVWNGAIPDQGSNVDIRYYIVATNNAGWPGTSPRGAEYSFHQFHVGGTTAVGDGSLAARLALAPPRPNPVSGSSLISFEIDRALRADLSIFDTAGRKVRTLLQQEVEPGVRRVLWDGTDDRGQIVSDGIYFVRLTAGGRAISGKLVVLH